MSDPRHFGTDPDADVHPRIRTGTFDKQIRLRILLFSSMTLANKKKFFSKFLCLFLFEGTLTSFFEDKKVVKKSQNIRNQGFSSFFAC